MCPSVDKISVDYLQILVCQSLQQYATLLHWWKRDRWQI